MDKTKIFQKRFTRTRSTHDKMEKQRATTLKLSFKTGTTIPKERATTLLERGGDIPVGNLKRRNS